MNARKLIIDCDPGIDDSLALMLAAASKELDLVGITTVSGNVPASMGAKNALKILSMIGKPDVPVYVGEETPLVRDYVDAMDTHGMDGLGESGWPDAEGLTPNKDAVSFLIETAGKCGTVHRRISELSGADETGAGERCQLRAGHQAGGACRREPLYHAACAGQQYRPRAHERPWGIRGLSAAGKRLLSLGGVSGGIADL